MSRRVFGRPLPFSLHRYTKSGTPCGQSARSTTMVNQLSWDVDAKNEDYLRLLFVDDKCLRCAMQDFLITGNSSHKARLTKRHTRSSNCQPRFSKKISPFTLNLYKLTIARQADTRTTQDLGACDTRKGKTRRSLFIKRVSHARVLIFSYNTLVALLGKLLSLISARRDADPLMMCPSRRLGWRGCSISNLWCVRCPILPFRKPAIRRYLHAKTSRSHVTFNV